LANGGGIWDLIEIIAVLGVVFWLAWFVTRFVARRSKGKAAGRCMRVVDRMSISSDKALLLVKIGSSYCVIGVSGREMSLIRTMDAAEAEAFKQAAAAGSQPSDTANGWKGMQSFGARLGMAMKRPAKPAAPDPQLRQEKHTAESSALDRMNERIKLRKETKRW
jgi:flagellar biosynthetic protein FliO